MKNTGKNTYHKTLGFPPEVYKMGKRRVNVCKISRHARQASVNDRLGEINIPSYFEFTPSDIIELDVISKTQLKFLIRLSHDYANDICIAILFDMQRNTNIIKTVWLNSKYDSHKTLDESKYTKIN